MGLKITIKVVLFQRKLPQPTEAQHTLYGQEAGISSRFAKLIYRWTFRVLWKSVVSLSSVKSLGKAQARSVASNQRSSH